MPTIAPAVPAAIASGSESAPGPLVRVPATVMMSSDGIGGKIVSSSMRRKIVP
ncbi:MAG: hypothetical protein PGN09_12620 [Sphingomonas fennica]